MTNIIEYGCESYIGRLKEKFDAIIAIDSEFSNVLEIIKKYTNYKEYKKIACEITFVLLQIAKLNSTVTVYEHPDVGANLLPSWSGSSVLPEYLQLKEVEKPKEKVETYDIACLFYFSAYDILGLFTNIESRIKIAKQLLGGRVLREKSFPNALRTGVYVEIPTKNSKGEETTIVKEIAIKSFDQRGYTPAGVSGLSKTYETWGVKFTNKNWTKYFNIADFKNEYINTVDMVEVTLDDGTTKWMSKHEICVTYASGDGVLEMFELYNKIHICAEKTLDKMGMPEYEIKNFGTIGNWANQVGVAACLKGLGMGFTKNDESNLARYFYCSSAYALLDEARPTIKQLLNVDGGYCKNMKPTSTVVKNLVSDNDLKGAYAGAMKSLPYCVGIPCVISYPEKREYRANFHKEFTKLEKKGQIYESAWAARVSTSTPLSFRQDIVYSKIFGETDFEKNLVDDDEGFFVIDESAVDSITEKKLLAEIPDGAFQLLNNETISGIITHDILQFIRTYWSKKEQNEFFQKVNIDCMIFYNKKFLLSPDEFKKEFQKLDNTIVHNFNNGQSYSDKRKPIWTIVPTNEGWFGDLVDIRDTLKEYAKIANTLSRPSAVTEEDRHTIKSKLLNFLNNEELTEDDRSSLTSILNILEKTNSIIDDDIDTLNQLASKYKCEQNGFKNVTNSEFGVCGSLWYQTEQPRERKRNGETVYQGIPKIGNIVFAQNITARVRVGSYCMAKGLNGYLVITDGTPYCINEVWSWQWKSEDKHYFGSEELWRLSRHNKPSDVDPKGRFDVKLSPLGGNEWVVKEVNEKTKKVTITNGVKTITGSEEDWMPLDNLAYEHVKNLFGEMDIFKNDVMKYASKDLFKGAAFQSQANYLFETFTPKENIAGNYTPFKTKARGYNLSKFVYRSPDMSDKKLIHPYEDMIVGIYEKDEADVYITSVFSPQLLGVDDFNKSDKVTEDYINRGFMPHSPYYRSSRPSPFSLSMFRWNTREQYSKWEKKVESWKSKTGFGIELLFLTNEMVNNKTPLRYSEVVRKIQEMIDDNFEIRSLEKIVFEKLQTLKHPQLVIEESHQRSLEEVSDI